MIRVMALLVIVAFAAAAIAASDRQKPLLVDDKPSGQWAFNNADYQQCLLIQPPPVTKSAKIPLNNLHPSELS